MIVDNSIELDHLDLVARNAEASLDILASEIVEIRGEPLHSNLPSTGSLVAARSPAPDAPPSVATIVQDFQKRWPQQSEHLLFWSGVGPDGAAAFGKKHSRHTLEELIIDNGQNKYSAYTSKPWASGGKEAWEALSKAIATFAKGEVWVVQTDAKRLDPGTVWARVERPKLKERGIAIKYFKPTGEEVDEKGNLKSGTKGDANTSPPASPKSSPIASPKLSPPSSPKGSPSSSLGGRKKSGRRSASKRAQLAKALRKRLVADASIAGRGLRLDSFGPLQWT